ncbi:hypothetical protein CLFO_31330 [Clostridium formicaceticum]|uniref:Uncharacterized protein n=1 Tax=Clostridium formicaceticum TaxID=1497 RepID=A0AAC9RN86_9CLOT|nr:hypothetical protein CLFO_31330 [Clostridium formicaceticum]
MILEAKGTSGCDKTDKSTIDFLKVEPNYTKLNEI